MQTARVVIEEVTPQLDGGRFPVKRVLGEPIVVRASVFSDRREELSSAITYRPSGEGVLWGSCAMEPIGQDRWQGAFEPAALGIWEYTVVAWVNEFSTWKGRLRDLVAAGKESEIDWNLGSKLVSESALSASGKDLEQLKELAHFLSASVPAGLKLELSLDDEIGRIIGKYHRPAGEIRFEPVLSVRVEPARARSTATYLLFPRSGQTPDYGGGLAACAQALDGIAAMGFDTVCLPPIHPVGETGRRGKDGREDASPKDVGNPWAIGSASGGHCSIDPELGSLDDFSAFLTRARELQLEPAMTLAFHCSHDHPYCTEHPEWFGGVGPSGGPGSWNNGASGESVRFFDFERNRESGLWEELRAIVRFWTGLGVRTFVANPVYGQPFSFWEWLIREVQKEVPDTVFQCGALARPSVMKRLAKCGFSQSITPFMFQNTVPQLIKHMQDLQSGDLPEYLRPSFWPNTPDILTQYLQRGGRAAFLVRFALAATLSPCYGVYGPAFELREATPKEEGSESYLNSEVFEVRHWNPGMAADLRAFMARVNRSRREAPCLLSAGSLRFVECANPRILCFVKGSTLEELVVVLANLDFHQTQTAWIDLGALVGNRFPDRPLWLQDLISDLQFVQERGISPMVLDPHLNPVMILRCGNSIRTEEDYQSYF